MKRHILITTFLSFILIGILPGSASAVVIGFEDFGIGSVTGPEVTNQYPELTFSSIEGYHNIVSTQTGIGDGNNFLCTAAIGGSIDCAHDTIVNFTNAVNNLTFLQVGDNFEGVGAKVDIYENGMFSGTQDIQSYNTFNTPDLVDLSAYHDVTSIRIHSIVDPGGLGWDNFSFDVAKVPEPASLALLGIGLLGIGFARKRR